MNFIFIGTWILIFYIWLFIGLIIFFIVKSSSIYKSLKYYEEVFTQRKKELLFHLIPIMVSCSDYNNQFETLLNIKNTPRKRILYSVTAYIFKTITLFQSIRLWVSLPTKLLR